MASTIKFISHLDLSGHEIHNMNLEILTTDPKNPTPGRTYFNSDEKKLKYFDGTDWQTIAVAGEDQITKEEVEEIVEDMTKSHVSARVSNEDLILESSMDLT